MQWNIGNVTELWKWATEQHAPWIQTLCVHEEETDGPILLRRSNKPANDRTGKECAMVRWMLVVLWIPKLTVGPLHCIAYLPLLYIRNITPLLYPKHKDESIYKRELCISLLKMAVTSPSPIKFKEIWDILK